MLKRLLVMTLLSLAMLLLLSLMVSGGAEPAPLPPVQTIQSVCLPARLLPTPQTEQPLALPYFSLDFSVGMAPREFSSDQNGLPVCGGAYYSANYLSFHFSDRAG